MARQYGVAGEWARVRGTVLSLWPLFLSFVMMGAFLASLILGSHPWLFGAMFVASLIALTVYWKKGLRRVESFFRGARGEERVANILASLPDDYHVFNDFEAGSEHVDHVVAGPAGVFSIETKWWQGTVEIVEGHVLVNGTLPSRDPVAQTQREADRVRMTMKKIGFDVTVVPVVCFASDTFAAGIAQCGPVKVLNANAINEWFATQPCVLSPNELSRLVQLIETRK
ncbi:MAG: NERD domain-containing protein [Lentisphaerae bacterium]|nr:NERD domain-containing protein [Lentisphaerota bacterium]